MLTAKNPEAITEFWDLFKEKLEFDIVGVSQRECHRLQAIDKNRFNPYSI